ncbi:distal tail protein Dit [Enterococcus dispar]|uniref:distal tail protein Dit n=1 Tax=Enterococcus dispar TaxID=44009 RepID=UPI00288DE477|nr:distal tail protein Dit [Enterococcus dispar]MDT2704806.1 phage tail family protein [Enterococcus dispar]
MKLSVKFNGHELNEYIEVTKLTRSIGPNRTNSLQKLGMTHGEHYLGYSKGAAIHEMKFAIISDLPEKKRELAGILDVNEPSELIFGDEPDKYMLAIPDSDVDFDDEKSYGNGTINWVVPEGYAHSVSESPFTATPNADGILTMAVVNNGTETAEMSFEATMTDDNGYLGVVGPLGAMEFGNIAEVDGYMDMAETVYNDQMVPSDASKWTVNGGYIAWLNSNAGLPNKVQGSFSWTGETVKATNFGTAYNDNRWYGPTIAKAIPAKTSDGKRDGNFVHRFWLNHKSKKNARCVGRQEVNLSDGVNPIATFVIYDDSSNSVRTCLEFTLFGIKQVRIVADKDFQEFYGTVEIMKIGNEITFKVYNIDTKKTITKTYYDERLGTAKITHKNYWCSRFMNLPICDMSLNYSFFQWIGSQEFVDVPNRYSSSDVLSYDGSTGKFYVNDTLAMNDIIVGSTDLKIPPGNWTVEFYYSDFGKTPPHIVGKLRERWL